ncbi:NGG1p interacting factor 3 [Gautieria morchelliformis]|nr:NGG1p interacting factor 3 [Gautieria morchelliformis]
MSIVPSVVRAMERIAPLHLAEKWDNVGLLVESPIIALDTERLTRVKFIITPSLTPAVLEEALSPPTSVIVSYHPPIFRPLGSLTLSNALQASLLKCAASGISVFSPHTALDCVQGGINDWLAQGFTGLGQATTDEQTGAGRLLAYQNAVSLGNIVAAMKAYLGLKYLQVASAPVPRLTETSHTVKSVAICAGSGGAMLKDVDADLYFTGEMSHHEVLAAVAKGTHVILCGHDNTERGYLPTLQEKLQDSLSKERDGPFEVVVSTRDRHPLDTV